MCIYVCFSVGIYDNNNKQSHRSLPKGDRAWGGEGSKNPQRHASNLELERGSSVVRRGDGVDNLEAYKALQAAGYRGKDKDFYKPSASSNGWSGKGKGKANGYYFDQSDRNSPKYFEDDYGGGPSRRDMYSGFDDEQSVRREIHATRKVRLPVLEKKRGLLVYVCMCRVCVLLLSAHGEKEGRFPIGLHALHFVIVCTFWLIF